MLLDAAVMMPKKTAKIEIRAEPDWVGKVHLAAKRKGLSASAYARMVITERMEHDGVPDIDPRRGRKPKGD